MAYAALLSLEKTIKCLLSSSMFPGEEVENVHMKVQSLKEALVRSKWSWPKTTKKADVLGVQMADAIYKLEDVLESFTSIESSFGVASCDEDVKQEIRCFLGTIGKIEVEIRESTTIAEDQSIASSYSLSGNEQNMMVGFEDDILALLDRLTGSTSRLDILPIVGMQGIGKTTLVNSVCKHPLIRHHFDVFAFVTIGQRCSARKTMLDILFQINWHQVDELNGENYEELCSFIYQMLKGRRYLLVLDDVWNIETWNELKMIFPDDNNGSRIIITTTLLELAAYAGSLNDLYRMRFMSLSESWTLLQMVVFGEEESCPLELESLGMKIAQNSQGLPIEIVWVGSLLCKREKTIEFWKEVAENYISYIIASDDEMSIFKKLYSSYEYLGEHLKACFLYMGVFPQNYAILPSKLIGLWISEGFLETKSNESLEQVAKNCLQDLVDRSMVIIHEQSSTGEIKTCRVHHLFWHLCVTEAERIKFFHVINGHTNAIPKATYIQRRLCIRKNIVLAIKDEHELMDSVSKARSLLCMAAHHQYPLPVCFEFKLLRVLDVLSIRFYNFPLAILKLIRLRYLTLTCNGELPPSISVLGRLQILIVRPHIRIRSCTSNPSFLPMDIWKLKELRHLYIIGSDLPNPLGEDQLSSLQILSGVSPQSCKIGVIEGIQQLKKLGIRIELTPSDDAAEPICPFDNLFLLHQLESFKCGVVNPNFGAQFIKLPDSNSVFSDSITKISLSGCGLPWGDMEKISLLPRLKVLKLREHAFTGADWETSEAEFPRLRLLLLESMDLVSWITTDESFPCLESLILNHCYQLEEIPLEIGYIPSLQLIELVDCSRCASDSVKQIADVQMDLGNELQVRVTSST